MDCVAIKALGAKEADFISPRCNQQPSQTPSNAGCQTTTPAPLNSNKLVVKAKYGHLTRGCYRNNCSNSLYMGVLETQVSTRLFAIFASGGSDQTLEQGKEASHMLGL